MQKLNDDELNGVSGGVMETADLPTKGKNIICPSCNKDNRLSKKACYDPKLGSVEYSCGCGCKFVCYGNDVLLKKDFLDLCIKNKYDYLFK